MKTLIKIAEEHCEAHGHRLTAPRRTVLDILLRAKKPIGAYDIINAMPGDVKPPTVYRALEFWQHEGFVHKISSLNAYTVCHAGHRHAGSQYLICDGCGDVEEVHLCHLPTPLQQKIESTGFILSYWSTELHGSCHNCQAGNSTPLTFACN